MAQVPVIGSGFYCIDTTEVNYTQYTAFYEANPSTSQQPSYCSWNSNYTPSSDWPPSSGQQTLPVHYVNWCQALAYCTYSGKTLCGHIGGGSVAASDLFNANDDAWFNACSAQGVSTYPYGSTYNGTACNGADAGHAARWVTTTTTCQGGEPGVYDMSGNLAEWEDACSGATDENDTCTVRGGSFLSDSSDLRCDSNLAADDVPRDYSGADVGIRCCL